MHRKSKNSALIATIAACMILAGCAGTPFKWDQARKVQKGMTESEVTALLGPPNNVAVADGVTRYVWVHVNLAMASRTLRIDFKDGKVVDAPPIPESFQD